MVLASIGLFLAGQQAAAALGLVSALFAGIGLLLPSARPAQPAADPAPELSAAQRQHEEAQKAVAEQDTETKAKAAPLGFAWPMTEDDLTQLEGSIAAAERRTERHNTLLQRTGRPARQEGRQKRSFHDGQARP